MLWIQKQQHINCDESHRTLLRVCFTIHPSSSKMTLGTIPNATTNHLPIMDYNNLVWFGSPDILIVNLCEKTSYEQELTPI